MVWTVKAEPKLAQRIVRAVKKANMEPAAFLLECARWRLDLTLDVPENVEPDSENVIFGDKSVFAIECAIEDQETLIGRCCFHFPNGTLGDITQGNYEIFETAGELSNTLGSFSVIKDIALASLPAQDAFTKIDNALFYREGKEWEEIKIGSFWYSRFQWVMGPHFDAYKVYLLADPNGYRFIWKKHEDDKIIESIIPVDIFEVTICEFFAWCSIYSGKDFMSSNSDYWYLYKRCYNKMLGEINKKKKIERKNQQRKQASDQ
jgi:hypothetical protein